MIGWIGNLFIIIGMVFVAYKRRSGFLLGIIGNSLWCLQAVLTGQWDLLFIEIIVVFVSVFSFWKWGHGTSNTIHSESA